MSILESFGFVVSLGIFLIILKSFAKSCQQMVGLSQRQDFLKKKSVLTLAILGAIMTAIAQSSSVIMVMTIGLVESNVLTKKNGLALILGTEIGTTTTAQLLSLPKEMIFYIMPFLIIVAMVVPRLRKLVKPMIWFTLLISSMTIMAIPLEGLTSDGTNNVLRELLVRSNGNRFLGIVIGFGFTALIQSSSALTALAMNLARAGVLKLSGAFALVVGANLGTCITGFIASFAFSKSVKTMVVGQIMFNFLGVILMLTIFDPFLELVVLITKSGLVERQIANGQTIFNLLSFILVLPFYSYFFNLVNKITMKVL